MRIITIAILIFAVTFSSCGKHTKILTKEKTVDRSEKVTTDHSLVYTYEQIDTTVKHSYAEVLLDMVADSGSDSVVTKMVKKDGISLTIGYNKKAKVFTAKATKDSTIDHIAFNKTTVQHNDIAIAQHNDIVTESKHREATHDYTLNSKLLFAGIILVVLFVLIWLYFKFKI